MITIELNDWVVSGAGARGTSYFHKDNPDLMLKFDDLLTDATNMELELEAARAAFNNGVKTPEPGEVVTDGKRYGVTFKRIHDKISYAKAIMLNPERIEKIAASFTKEVKQLHSTEVDTSSARSIKEVYGNSIKLNKLRTEEEKNRVLDLLESMPDGTTCIHGDLHYGNIVFGDGGSWFIDMGNFSYGYPFFDLAMLKSITCLSKDEPNKFKDFFHFDSELAPVFWNLFLKGYFGEDADIGQIEESLAPYLAIRLLTIETETSHSMKHSTLQTYLDKVL